MTRARTWGLNRGQPKSRPRAPVRKYRWRSWAKRQAGRLALARSV